MMPHSSTKEVTTVGLMARAFFGHSEYAIHCGTKVAMGGGELWLVKVAPIG